MRWVIGNTLIWVSDAERDERNWLVQYLSYTDRRFHPGKGHYVSAQVTLYQLIDDRFPAGFGRAAFKMAQAQGFTVDIDDPRVVPCQPDPAADLEWLRHHPAVPTPITHQIEGVEAAVKNKRGILWLPTGAGKTEIAIGISKALPCKTLFFVHRADLLAQTAERFQTRTGLPAGVLGDGVREIPPGCRFVAVMFQTAHSALKTGRRDVLDEIEGAECIIVDEVHSLPADSFYEVVMRAERAYYRFGLSGTPLARGDGRNLLTVGALGPVIYRVMPEVLIRIGLLSNPKIRMVEHRVEPEVMERLAPRTVEPDDAADFDLSEVITPKKARWRQVYSAAVTKSKARHKRTAEIAAKAAKPCLVFVQEVQHGKAVADAVRRKGMQAEFVWGEEPTAARQAAIKRLVRGEIDVLVCNVIFQEGIDIPSLMSVVVATGGQSTIAALQRIGRGMRADVTTGKTDFEVWDLADIGCGCSREDPGGEHPGCRWLRKHTRARIKAYKSEGFTPKIEETFVLTEPKP